MAKVMTTQQKRDKYTKNGKGWCEDSLVSIEPYEHHGKSSVGVHIGEEYFETDPYSRKDFALCEAKGWLEAVKVQIGATITLIDKEIDEIDKANK